MGPQHDIQFGQRSVWFRGNHIRAQTWAPMWFRIRGARMEAHAIRTGFLGIPAGIPWGPAGIPSTQPTMEFLEFLLGFLRL